MHPIKLYLIFIVPLAVIYCSLSWSCRSGAVSVKDIQELLLLVLDLLAQKYSGCRGADRRFIELRTNNLESAQVI